MNLRNLLFASILTLFSFSVYAAPVDPARAINVAEQFMPAKQISPKQGKAAPAQLAPEIVYTHYMPKSGKPAIYIININGGFALVSADDVAHPVLGYNYGKPWPTDVDSLAPSIKGFLDDLASQMEAASEHPQDAETAAEWQQPRHSLNRSPRRAKMDDNLPDNVDPLLTTTWDQGQYYNALCPEDPNGPNGHALTGCVATAMAQIIKYWGDKQEIKTRGIHSYDSNYGNLRVNYDSTSYNFANMPNALSSENTQQEVNAVAQLMYGCGVAANMEYGSSESSAFDVEARAALINYFKFSPDLSFAERQYFNSIEWGEMLREEIAAERPVFYSGRSEYGLGHSFICNGYNAAGYFYFNFGWGGLTDGWYFNDAVMGYNSNQSALLGIVPDNSVNVILGQTQGNSSFIVDDPIEFYHLMGHNKYQCTNYPNSCSNKIVFVSAEHGGQLVVDVLDFEDQNVNIYDGIGDTSLLRDLHGGSDSDLSPIVSSDTAMMLVYNGIFDNTGFKLQISQNSGCRMVSNIVASVDTTTVHLTWTENGTATQWQVEYGVKGFTLGEGIRQTVSTNTIDITNLQKFTEYDIYIRSVCEEEQYGMWNKVVVMAEAPYWHEIVTQQPEGYYEDFEGNVIISSAEGLSWFSKLSMEDNFLNRHVYLTSDINLAKYKWTPICAFSGVFDGCGHRIDSMFIMESVNQCVGLFSYVKGGTVKDIILTNCYNKNALDEFGGAAGLVGSLSAEWESPRRDTILNCIVSGIIEGYGSEVAGVVANIRDGVVINCASNCILKGYERRTMIGGIAADALNWGGSVVKNCYSRCTILSGSSSIERIGGIIGYVENGILDNCYVSKDSRGLNKIMNGDMSEFIDLAWFNKCDSGYYLDEPILFDMDSMYYSNLKDVLNAGIRKFNIEGLRIWEDDSLDLNEGMPILGEEYHVSCPNVQHLMAKNVVDSEGNVGVKLSWEETGEATIWEIKYHNKDSLNDIRLVSSHNPDTIFDLLEHNTYLFSVRPICGICSKGAWSDKVSLVVKQPYWTDIVTTKPDGYVVDSKGNVTISTAEGLAWFSCVTNGLNGEPQHTFDGQIVSLICDVNIGKYIWKPINGFQGVFNGGNYRIRDLVINELCDNVGLFGTIQNCSFSNVTIDNANVNGLSNVGILAGYARNIIITNCHVSGNVHGESEVGGLVGSAAYGELIDCCSAYCYVEAEYDDAGGLLGSAGRANGEPITYNIRNCFSHSDVTSGRYSVGGLIGTCNANVNNCFATGNIVGWLYNGGLFGGYGLLNVDCELSNCYFGGNVTKTEKYFVNDQFKGYLFGSIVATTWGNPIISNCYASYDEEPYILVGTPNYVEGESAQGTPILSNISAFSKENEVCTLFDNVIIDKTCYANMLSALNAWVDANNEDGKYRHWVADTENVNGGFPIFAPQYTITFQNEDGTILQISTLEEGEMPVAPADPTKEVDEQYTYSFAGWQPEIVAVTGDATYTATYIAHVGTALPIIEQCSQPTKIIEDGYLFILLPNGTRYTATGMKVE